MRNAFVLILILFNFSVNALAIKNQLSNVKNQFFVFEIDKLISIIKIDSINKDLIEIEEINIPLNDFTNYQTWVNEGSCKFSSWIKYTIDSEKAEILSAYSVSRKCYITHNHESSFLKHLLSLSLKPISKDKRKKIGPKPSYGFDTRPLWNPPLTIDGKVISKPKYTVYTATWPKDTSPLSQKELHLYFAKELDTFPYWAEVFDPSGISFRIRGKDAGYSSKKDTLYDKLPPTSGE